MRNYPEWVISFAAITSIGAISVSLNAWWTTEELDYALRDSGSVVVVADAERAKRIAPLLSELSLSVIRVRTEEPPAGVDRWDDVVTLGASMPEVGVDPEFRHPARVPGQAPRALQDPEPHRPSRRAAAARNPAGKIVKRALRDEIVAGR